MCRLLLKIAVLVDVDLKYHLLAIGLCCKVLHLRCYLLCLYTINDDYWEELLTGVLMCTLKICELKPISSTIKYSDIKLHCPATQGRFDFDRGSTLVSVKLHVF